MTLGQETRWAYSTMLPSPHRAVLEDEFHDWHSSQSLTHSVLVAGVNTAVAAAH